jgi:hypothetical protein
MIIALALALSGCQLAKPDAEAQKEKDMLVGVFITQEHLDLFDMEAYLQDNLSALPGGTLSIEDAAQYSNRVWAEFTEDSDGHSSYRFGDLEGSLLASFRITPDGKSENAYWGSEVGEGICDVSFGHHSLDDGSRLELSGTVYFSDTHPDPGLYFNPVYQTPEGDVYLLAGQGTFFGAAGMGCRAGHTMKEETSRTENGEKIVHSTEISITMECVYPARNLVILQMDADNQILSRQEWNSGSNPEELKPGKNCAYILVEEHTANGIRRNLYQREDSRLFFFRELENRMCMKAQIYIVWPE